MCAKRIILVTGGQRSGKSEFAERLALKLSSSPVYIATAEALDDEMRRRVQVHQQRRGPEWSNIEERLFPGSHDLDGRTVLLDCVTMWCTNFFFHCGESADDALERIKAEYDRLIHHDATFIFVTAETGLGGISENPMQRHFTDLLSAVNRHIADTADEVYLLISGIDIKIK